LVVLGDRTIRSRAQRSVDRRDVVFLALRAFLPAAGAQGCSDSGAVTSVESDAESAQDAPSAGDAPSWLPDLNAIRCEPTGESIQKNLFGVACSWDNCHGGNTTAFGLRLVETPLEPQLFEVPSSICKDWVRVVRGAPEQSFLWQKLAAVTPPCGERMPFGLGRLPDAVLACVSGWIASLSPGAADAAAQR
jgi:hypothetical protein